MYTYLPQEDEGGGEGRGQGQGTGTGNGARGGAFFARSSPPKMVFPVSGGTQETTCLLETFSDGPDGQHGQHGQHDPYPGGCAAHSGRQHWQGTSGLEPRPRSEQHVMYSFFFISVLSLDRLFMLSNH
jgi:hypothetical protein